MKRLLIVSAVAFTLMVTPCFAIEYCKDFLESGNPGGWSASLKTFDDEWTLNVGDEVEVDIWINDVPTHLLSAGFWMEFDPTKVSVVNVNAYDYNPLPGPWEIALTTIYPEPSGPGTYLVTVAPSLVPGPPDADGDYIIARVKFRCESEGDATITISTIQGFDTVVGNPNIVFDPDITNNNVIIHQVIDICEGDFDGDGDQDGTDAAVFKSDFGRSPFNRPCPPLPTTTTTIPSGCPYGMIDCGTKCVDPQTDEDFCGVDSACIGGVVCGTTERCVAGVCEIIGDVVYQAALPKTGQTTCYDSSGIVISCTDTGQDGEYQKGVTWPNPRFTDNSDGTVIDNLTGLIWLKDANCIATHYPEFDNDETPGDGLVIWQHALDFVTGINNGTYPDCGAGSTDWRLPNRNELASLVVHDEYYNPAVQNTAGTGQWSEGDPFNNLQSSLYWSSTTYAFSTALAWNVYMSNALVGSGNKPNDNYVWPVRGEQ